MTTAAATETAYLTIYQLAPLLCELTGLRITYQMLFMRVQRLERRGLPTPSPIRRDRYLGNRPAIAIATIRRADLPLWVAWTQETFPRDRPLPLPRPPLLALHEVADALCSGYGLALTWHRLHTALKHPACPVPMVSFRLSGVHFAQPGMRRADIPAMAEWLLAGCPAQPGQLQLPVAQ